MAVAWLLLMLAMVGVCAGAYFERGEMLQEHLSAAGGGLLFGVSIFWLLPEIGETLGLPTGLLITLAVTAALALVDWALTHRGHSARQGVLWPLLTASALHSFLDGWSVRALALHPFTDSAVAIGLALHKVPEGAALGWILRKASGSRRKALIGSALVESFTLLGAFVQPTLNASGNAQFGVRWTASALAVIAGGFLFLGFHAVMPHWKQRNVLAVFMGMLLLVGALTLIHGASI